MADRRTLPTRSSTPRKLIVGVPKELVCRVFGHDWEYDEAESKGPWTGYIERCSRCGALQQVPQ